MLARLEFRGRKLFLDLILITQMFSPGRPADPAVPAVQGAGLLGDQEGVILAGAAFTLPFSIWLLTGFFRADPGRDRGGRPHRRHGRFGVLVRMILPLSVPGLVATGVYAFIIGWNEFIFAVTFLAASPDNQPISVGVFANIGKWDIDWQRLMFMALLGTLPVLVIFAAIQKQLDRGFSAIASGR